MIIVSPSLLLFLRRLLHFHSQNQALLSLSLPVGAKLREHNFDMRLLFVIQNGDVKSQTDKYARLAQLFTWCSVVRLDFAELKLTRTNCIRHRYTQTHTSAILSSHSLFGTSRRCTRPTKVPEIMFPPKNKTRSTLRMRRSSNRCSVDSVNMLRVLLALKCIENRMISLLGRIADRGKKRPIEFHIWRSSHWCDAGCCCCWMVHLSEKMLLHQRNNNNRHVRMQSFISITKAIHHVVVASVMSICQHKSTTV